MTTRDSLQQLLKRLVVKIGSSVLTNAHGQWLPSRIDQLVDQIAACRAQSRQVVLVSSGAIACGMAELELRQRPKSLAQLQACAAVGQGLLMHVYTQSFARHRIRVGQLLLTQDDLSTRSRFRNAKQTLLALLHRRIVPIVNENDTVAVEEITFGDNDRLAALVASAISAQGLVVLSDVDGFLQDGRVVDQIDVVNQTHRSAAGSAQRQTTKGGMASKLEAARIAGHSGIPMIIANGTTAGTLTRLVAGQTLGTVFVPPRSRLTSKQWWIAFALRRPHGTVVIDSGAARALIEQGRSLLASGIQEIQGRFESGACIAIVESGGRELGRGICAYSSAELNRIQGLKSAPASQELGRPVREVIHRNQLVLLQDTPQ